MKKIIASLTLAAALAAALPGGAQAQTVSGTGSPAIYTLTVTPNAPTNIGSASSPLYQYSYLVTLATDPSTTDVTTFSINNIQGYVLNSAGVTDDLGTGAHTSTDFGSTTPIAKTSATTGLTSISFAAASSGLVLPGNVPTTFVPVIGNPVVPGTNGAGDSVIFKYQSTLPPSGTVSLSSNGQGGTATGNLAGTGASVGPGLAVVPESSSFALLGLGLLPLGLLARRRIARKN